MKAFVRANYFFIGLVFAIGFASLRPDIGAGRGAIPTEVLQPAGVFLIFFTQGLSLRRETLLEGISNIRLHVCAQSAGYLLIPLLAALFLFISSPYLVQEDLRVGFLYLAILPTTITSAVAFTVMVKGDVGGALFNTTFSNVVGVFAVPAICLVILSAKASVDVPVATILGGVGWKILFPVGLGQLLRPVLGGFAERHSLAFRRLNVGIILFIVYVAFCQSFDRGVWGSVGFVELLLVFAGVFFLLCLNSLVVWIYSGAFGLRREGRVAAFFCGSQKTLAAGLPLSVSIFGAVKGGPDLGLVIVPLLLYHPAQLLLAGLLLPRLRTFVESQ